MAKRTRNKHLSLMLTDEEFDFFKQRQKLSGIRNYTDFLIKTVANSQVINIDTRPFLVLAEQINKIGVNINQIARVANTTGCIYENDISLLRDRITEIENLVNAAMVDMSNLREGGFNGICKNKTHKE